MGTTLVALLARRRNPYPSPRAWDYTVLLAPAATGPRIPGPIEPSAAPSGPKAGLALLPNKSINN